MANLDNYIWIVVVGIILVMTFIGYIAEKTDFGRQKIEKIDNKEAKKEKKTKEVKASKLKLNEAVYNKGETIPKVPIESTPAETVFNEPIISEVDSFGEIIPTVEPEINISSASEADSKEKELISEEDLTVPLSDVENVEDEEIIDEDIWKF